MISDKVRPHHLERKAILYVRQSSAHQVLHNRESGMLQYAMRDRLTALGWSEIEVIDDRSNVPTGRHHGAPKHGDALLACLIRCKRCSRKLTLRYSGMKHYIPRYSCSRAWMDNGGPHCIGFGGLRVDDAIEEALLGVVGRALSPLQPLPPMEPENGVIRFAMLSVATSKRRAMPPTGLSGDTMPLTPRTGW